MASLVRKPPGASRADGLNRSTHAANNAAPAMEAAHIPVLPGQRSEGTLTAVRVEIAPPRPVAIPEAEAPMAPSLMKSAVEPAEPAAAAPRRPRSERERRSRERWPQRERC
jgi:hypothetical protein